jgi:aerobic carbon-monoxide dehydrogenase small subunit
MACSARAKAVGKDCAAAVLSWWTKKRCRGASTSRSGSTVEHLDAGGALSHVQQAFVACGAFQCGFCTPGFVLMTHQLLKHYPDPSDEDIRHYLAGNLCRCAAYPEIVAAVKQAAKTAPTRAGQPQ